jgi:hypothetical protein
MGLRWFAGVVGIVFLLLGVLGFFLDHLYGWIHFDLMHNIIHLIVGFLGILTAGSVSASKSFAKVLGIFYMLVGIIGFFIPELFGHMMLEMSENMLHLLVGGIALYVGYVAETKYAVKKVSTQERAGKCSS